MCAEIAALPGGHVVVTLSSDLDAVTALAARHALAEATRQPVTGVIADLAAVTFLDAAGLGVLAGAAGRARHLPGGLRLTAVPPDALRLLKLTRLDSHLATYPMPPHRQHPRTDTAPLTAATSP
jgi:anti-sigma B factor antagonist